MEIFIIIGLILLNGILSMSEIALVSARKARLEVEAKRGNKSAQTALKLAGEPDRFLSTIQIGITLIGILTGLYSGEAFAANLAEVVRHVPALEPYGPGTVEDYHRYYSNLPDTDHGRTCAETYRYGLCRTGFDAGGQTDVPFVEVGFAFCLVVVEKALPWL